MPAGSPAAGAAGSMLDPAGDCDDELESEPHATSANGISHEQCEATHPHILAVAGRIRRQPMICAR